MIARLLDGVFGFPVPAGAEPIGVVAESICIKARYFRSFKLNLINRAWHEVIIDRYV